MLLPTFRSKIPALLCTAFLHAHLSGGPFGYPEIPKASLERIALPGGASTTADEVAIIRPRFDVFVPSGKDRYVLVEQMTAFSIEGLTDVTPLVISALGRMGFHGIRATDEFTVLMDSTNSSIPIGRGRAVEPVCILRGTVFDFTKMDIEQRSEFSIRILAELSKFLSLQPSISLNKLRQAGHFGFELVAFDTGTRAAVPGVAARSLTITETGSKSGLWGLVGFGSGIQFNKTSARSTSIGAALNSMVDRVTIVTMCRLFGVPYGDVLQTGEDDPVVLERFDRRFRRFDALVKDKKISVDAFRSWQDGIQAFLRDGTIKELPKPPGLNELLDSIKRGPNAKNGSPISPPPIGMVLIETSGLPPDHRQLLFSILQSAPGNPVIAWQGARAISLEPRAGARPIDPTKLASYIQNRLRGRTAFRFQVQAMDEARIRVHNIDSRY